MTSFIAAGGSGRSTSFIPAVPAAWSVTTIALMNFSAVICLFAGNVAASECPLDAGAIRRRLSAVNATVIPSREHNACLCAPI